MGTPVIRGFIPKDPNLSRLCHKAKLQRTLTGEISEEVAKEIEGFFGECDTCSHQVHRRMYNDEVNGAEFTACGLVGTKQHLLLRLITKVAANVFQEQYREIRHCTGHVKKPTSVASETQS